MQKELENLGFLENEAQTYLTLLENGSMSPYELADKTGLNRSYLYDLLNRMADKGYVSTVRMQNKIQFTATAPKQLHQLFLLRAEEFKRMLPQLETIPKQQEETTTELHKGKHVFRTLIKDVLSRVQQDMEILIIAADESEFEKVEPILLKQYFRKLNEFKVHERVLARKGDTLFASETTEYRELPDALIGNSSIFIYGDTVAEILLANTNFMTITRNQDMADTKRKLFEHFWSETNAVH